MTGNRDAALTWHLPALDAQRMKVLALLLADPNPIHFDPDATHRLGLGSNPVNQGPSTMAMVYNLFAATHPFHRVRRLQARLLANVFAGQGISVTAWRATDDECYRVEVRSDDGALVLEGNVELVAQAAGP